MSDSLDPKYHRIDPDELDATPDFPCDRRSISDDAELATLAAAVYELDPGEQLSRTYHYHAQREELFYVRSGTISVETPKETFEVGADEVFVAKPKSPIRPHNPEDAEESAIVLGIGAPKNDIGLPYDPGS